MGGAWEYTAKNYRRAAQLLGEVVRKGDQSPGAIYNYATALIAIDSTVAAAELLERIAGHTDAETQYRVRFNGGPAPPPQHPRGTSAFAPSSVSTAAPRHPT